MTRTDKSPRPTRSQCGSSAIAGNGFWFRAVEPGRSKQFTFMKTRTLSFIAALIGLAASGCSKHTGDAATPSVTNTNLGVVEVADGVPIRHALGDGRAYILTPTVSKDGSVELRLDLQVTNASGEVKTVQGPTSRNLPGSQVQMRMGVEDISISVTPKVTP